MSINPNTLSNSVPLFQTTHDCSGLMHYSQRDQPKCQKSHTVKKKVRKHFLDPSLNPDPHQKLMRSVLGLRPTPPSKFPGNPLSSSCVSLHDTYMDQRPFSLYVGWFSRCWCVCLWSESSLFSQAVDCLLSVMFKPGAGNHQGLKLWQDRSN